MLYNISRIPAYIGGLFIILSLQILMSFQGFDVCDEGFSLSFYQQFFNSPESVEYNFIYWLSGLIGGTCYTFFNIKTILGFRVLAVIINTVTFIISYKILINFINKKYALLALVMILIVNDYGYMVFYHNHLSSLLAVSSIGFLLKGLTRENLYAICFSGMLIAINVFSRLSNVSLFIFIVGIPLYYFFNKISFKKSIKPTGVFVLGLVLGFLLIIGLMNCLNHLEIMKQSILGIIDSGNAADSNHSFKSLFRAYLIDYKLIALSFLKLILISILLLGLRVKIKNGYISKMVVVLVGFVLFIFLFKNNTIHMLYSMSLLSGIVILTTKQNTGLKLLATLSLLMALFLPFGSDLGIFNIGYASIWLIFPLFFHIVFEIKTQGFLKKLNIFMLLNSILKKDVTLLVSVLILSYFTIKVYNISQEAYFDKGSRFNKIYVINNKFARKVLTTKERANIINTLLPILEKYTNPNDYLFVYDKMPMLHFLTETRPYIKNPWVWIYDAHSFEENITESEKEIPYLPIIIQQKFETIGQFSRPQEDYMSEHKKNDFKYNSDRTAAMNSFIKRHKYRVAWSNAYFNIYKPDDNLLK